MLAEGVGFASQVCAPESKLTWSLDQVYHERVKTVLISEFKAKCIQLLKEVQKNGKPLTVTLRGEPIARVEPVPKPSKRIRLGTMKGRIEIKGDIIRSDLEKDWLER